MFRLGLVSSLEEHHCAAHGSQSALELVSAVRLYRIMVYLLLSLLTVLLSDCSVRNLQHTQGK